MSETWTINFEPPTGGRLTGKLTVDDRELRFVALYNSGNEVIIKSISNDLASLAGLEGDVFSVSDDADGIHLVICKEEIVKVEAKNSLLAKRVVVSTAGGEACVFNYGMLSVGKLIQAIEG